MKKTKMVNGTEFRKEHRMNKVTEWELVEFRPSRGNNTKKHKTVWFTKATKGAKFFSKMHISKDIAEELGLKAGDRMTLYRNRERTAFKLRKEPVGLITLKEGMGGTLYYQSTSFCLNFDFGRNGTEFDAHTDVNAGEIIFVSKLAYECVR